MKTKYWIVAIFAAAVLVAGLAWSLDTGLIGGSAPTAGSVSSQAAAETPSTVVASADFEGKSLPTTNGKQHASTQAGTSKSSSREQAESSTAAGSARLTAAAATATRPSWDPQPPASEAAGLEMPTEAPSARKNLPKSKDRKRALPSKPPAGESKGKLTSGFPKKAVPHPSGTAITASSVSSQGKRILVSLEGRSTTSQSEIIAFYAEDFAAKGWASTPSVPRAGESTLEGGYKGDSVVVTTRELPTGQTAFVVAGAFTVGG